MSILGVPVHPVKRAALGAEIVRLVRERQRAIFLYANAHQLNLAHSDPELRAIFEAAHLVLCDGVGVKWAGRLLGHDIPQRITYADWVWDLAGLCRDEGISLYFLGARPGVAERAAARLVERFPGLCVLGTRHGYFDPRPGSVGNEAVCAAIRDADPDLLVTALGPPLQERWLARNWPALGVRVGMTGGGVLDYVAGDLRRGPRWMTDHGLEWLARLAVEPRRLWRRYLVGNPRFVLRVARERLAGGADRAS